jgi:hypothetical protein
MPRSRLLVRRAHDGSPRPGPDDDNAVLVGVIEMRSEHQHRPAGISDCQHRIGSIGLPPEPDIPREHTFGHEQAP